MRKTLWWIIGTLGVLVLMIGFTLVFIDEPLRRYVERELNNRVAGYTFSIGALDFHPLGLSLDLEEVTIAQTDNPDPPVAYFPKWSASVHWRKLLTGNFVSDHSMDRPKLHITRSQAKKEAKDDMPIEERGWQDAVLAVYPLEINELSINDGDITYLDSPKAKPLRLRNIHFKAENIRNIESGDNTYPSRVHLDSRIFEDGRLLVDGSADFLAKPHLGINADVELERADLDDLVSLAGRLQFQIHDGLLTAKGHVEYAPSIKVVKLTSLQLQNMRMDYIHTAKPNRAGEKAAKETARAAQKAGNKPELLLKIDHGNIEDSEFGFVNQATKPDYRVFINGTDIYLENFSNRLTEGTAIVRLRGMFMGNGATMINGVFRPEIQAPDFDLDIRVIKAHVKSMNALLRAYGQFDVAAGLFSVYTELKAKNGRIDGYVKPLFKDLDVYNPEQDKKKSLLSKIYEGVIGGVTDVLENTPRDEVATKADVSGPVKDPQASTWDVVVKLVQNAFFVAILPGFERT